MLLLGVLWILIFLPGCDLTYKVRNQHSSIENIIHFPCGKITSELVGKGDSKFVFVQKFDLDEDVYVQVDSLRIYCNDLSVKVNHNLKKFSSTHGLIRVKDKKRWEASFQVEKGVFEGDTIWIYAPAYLQCHDQFVTLDSLVFAFVNNLRIFGVNDL